MKKETIAAEEIATPIALVTIPVPYYLTFDQAGCKDILFRVFRHDDWFRAVPETCPEEYGLSGLPVEIIFLFTPYVVLMANRTDEETMNVIKKIILELQVQDLL